MGPRGRPGPPDKRAAVSDPQEHWRGWVVKGSGKGPAGHGRGLPVAQCDQGTGTGRAKTPLWTWAGGLACRIDTRGPGFRLALERFLGGSGQTHVTRTLAISGGGGSSGQSPAPWQPRNPQVLRCASWWPLTCRPLFVCSLSPKSTNISIS